MTEIIHGYARMTDTGRLVLGFNPQAPAFTTLADAKPTFELIEATMDGDDVIAYSVVQHSKGNGFLWYADERNEAFSEAVSLSKKFGKDYDCLPLKMKV